MNDIERQEYQRIVESLEKTIAYQSDLLANCKSGESREQFLLRSIRLLGEEVERLGGDPNKAIGIGHGS